MIFLEENGNIHHNGDNLTMKPEIVLGKIISFTHIACFLLSACLLLPTQQGGAVPGKHASYKRHN